MRLIIHTNNFPGFQTGRQIASYCGCAPFSNKSGDDKQRYSCQSDGE
ncbi:MAG: IS110 family transposase [Cytophagaceae bacterium]|nr:IS110 family transposase [Cytophagaceae bacterium]